MLNKIRYGLLGASQIARGVHIDGIRASANSELLGIASRRAAKAAEWAKDLAIPKAYASYEEMLADREIDAVLVSLPMSAHCEWIVKAADAGKHVLCEKPMALSNEEMDQIMAAAERNGVTIMEAFSHRFPDHLPHVKKLIQSGAIGDIRIVKSEVIYTTADWENDTRAQAELGGCVTVEAGCYCANTILYFMEDDPIHVHGLSVQREEGGIDTSFTGIMRFPSGRLAIMSTSMETCFRASAEIIGTEGRIEIPTLFHGFEIKVIRQDSPEEQTIKFANASPRGRFTRQIEQFSKCLLDKAPAPISLEESRRTTKLLMQLKHADKPVSTY